MDLSFKDPVARDRGEAPGLWAETVEIDGNTIPVHYKRNERARRYVLRIDREGRVRVTIPRRGSLRQAQELVRHRHRWLSQHLRRFSELPKRGAPWHDGHEIHLRGSLTLIRLQTDVVPPLIRLGNEWTLELPAGFDATADLRPWVERHLRSIAGLELPARTVELAARHGVVIGSIQVRSQISRWGSCSCKGTLSLNWRLIQTPLEVRDYIILHELMHRRHMNHSAKFWACVAQACPDYALWERWLNEHGRRIL